jgi:hypothetical protein
MITLMLVVVGGLAFMGIMAGLMLRVLDWYIEGAISGLMCVIIVGLCVGLMISIILSPTSSGKVVVAVLIVLFFVGLIVASRLLDRRDTRAFEAERMAGFREAIAIDPGNLAARTNLAKTLYEVGRLDEAIDEMSEVVRRSPGNREETYRLNQFIREREEWQSPPIACPSCGHQNSGDRTRCENCESQLNIGREIRDWLRNGGLKQVIIYWCVVMGIMTSALFMLSWLSMLGRVLVVSLILLVATSAELLYMYRQI